MRGVRSLRDDRLALTAAEQPRDLSGVAALRAVAPIVPLKKGTRSPSLDSFVSGHGNGSSSLLAQAGTPARVSLALRVLCGPPAVTWRASPGDRSCGNAPERARFALKIGNDLIKGNSVDHALTRTEEPRKCGTRGVEIERLIPVDNEDCRLERLCR
jgi:hypothetical protein